MAILNSKLFWWYLVNTGTVLANDYFRFKPNYVKPFPLPIISQSTDLQLEKLVDKIIEFKKGNSRENIEIIDAEINQIIFKLYDLTSSEIELINKA